MPSSAATAAGRALGSSKGGVRAAVRVSGSGESDCSQRAEGPVMFCAWGFVRGWGGAGVRVGVRGRPGERVHRKGAEFGLWCVTSTCVQ